LTAFGARACPTLVTPRLELAAHTAEDFPDMLAMWREPAVVKHFGGEPSTGHECWARLLRYGGMWSLLGFGYWRARERATGRFVGEVGFAEFRRAITPAIFGTPEAGWVTATWAHGQGLAREATDAVFAWADTVLAAPRIVCLIDPANAPSLVLADRLGFKPFADTIHNRKPAMLLERFAPPSP
jgi:RimJ/RimL family protein N-acetyltransferase